MPAVSWLLAGLMLLLAMPRAAMAQGPGEQSSFAEERSIYEHAVAKTPAEIEATPHVQVSLPGAVDSNSAANLREVAPPALETLPNNDEVFAATETAAETASSKEVDVQSPASTNKVSKPLPRLSPLKRPERSDRGSLSRSSQGMATVAVSMMIVLGVFFGVVWMMRRGMPAAAGRLPTEVVEVLGRTPLVGKQQAHLIRCGNKLLLVSLSPGSIETLTEITDPIEVDRVAGLCKQQQAGSSTLAFRQVFQQFHQEKHDSGFLEPREEAVAESIMALLRRGAGKSATGGRDG